MKKKIKNIFKKSLIALILISGLNHASLTDLGNGIVIDSHLNIGWLKDTNMYKTLCDANDPIFLTWTGSVDNTKEDICDQDNGRMSWDDAQAWIEQLNTNNYLGISHWRLPMLVQPDASCELQSSGIGSGYNCIGSELGHLFNITLANPNNAGTGATGGTVGNGCSPCFLNTTPFDNPQTFSYWYDSLQNPGAAWVFNTGFGLQDGSDRSDGIYVWPVYTSRAPVPIPTLSFSNLLLFTIIILLIALMRFKRVTAFNHL